MTVRNCERDSERQREWETNCLCQEMSSFKRFTYSSSKRTRNPRVAGSGPVKRFPRAELAATSIDFTWRPCPEQILLQQHHSSKLGYC